MLEYLRQKKQLVSVSFIAIALVILAGMWFFSVKTPAYAVVVDGQQKFVVKDCRVVEQALKDISNEQSARLDNEKIQLNDTVKCKKAMVARRDIIPDSKVKSTLQQKMQLQATAVGIKVNGKVITYVANKDAAESVLNDLKKEYCQVEEGEKLISTSFQEKVTLETQKVALNKLQTKKQAFNLVITGGVTPEKYQVKEGDSLWLIARKNDMYVDEIVQANNLKNEDLQPGDELVLVKSKPYISVIAKVEGSRVEEIPFATRVETDRNAPLAVKVKQEGQKGEKQVAYTATKCNGVLSQKEILEEKILKAAVDKIVVKGSRVTMVASRGGGGSGSLSWPASGSITQGYRAGHSAIDIGARSGSPIRAAAGGTVSFAGYQGGYGRFIIINHGSGLVTRYAHCSSIAVSPGQYVNQGQVIGAVGSTGRSTGPHLHFEVLTGGAFRNPFNYLR